MCLLLRENSDKPYDNRDIRWKVVKKSKDKYYPPYAKDFGAYKNGWNTATKVNSIYSPLIGAEAQIGFHVFLTREAARSFKKSRRIWDYIVAKVEVRKFRRSGLFGSNPCETWNEMKIIK